MQKQKIQNLYVIFLSVSMLFLTVWSYLILNDIRYDFFHYGVCEQSVLLTQITVLSICVGCFGTIAYFGFYVICAKFYELYKGEKNVE